MLKLSKRKQLDFTGCQIGNLFVIKRTIKPNGITSTKNVWYQCRCVCGNEKAIRADNVRKFYNSCGCIKKPIRKGASRKKYERVKDRIPKDIQRLRNTWYKMKDRCSNAEDVQYKNYGGKGIYVCDKWLDFEGFKEDMYESYMEFEKINGKKSATIDRIDNNKPYELSNCRWATQLQQARNRDNNIKVEVEGVTYSTISELSEAYQINYETVRLRYQRGLREDKLVNKANIRNSNKVGTYYSNRKHYEKMQIKRNNKTSEDGI